MKRKKVIEEIEKLIKPITDERGLEIVDIEFNREPKGLVLRVFIDREGGVDLDLCASVSEEISSLLDVEDIIDKTYCLEVSSPGIERPLRKKGDFEKFKGKEAKIKTFQPVLGRRNFKGIIRDVSDDGFKVRVDEQEYEIGFDNLAKAKLVVEIKI